MSHPKTDASRIPPELAAVFELYRQKLPDEARALVGLKQQFLTGAEESREQLRSFLHRVAGTAGTYEHFDISNAAMELKRKVEAGEPPTELGGLVDGLIALIERDAQN